MDKKKVTILATVALALGAGPLVGLAHASGSTIYVYNASIASTDANCLSATHATIQSAVTDASDGDTIVVCAGLYSENVVDSGKALAFVGAQSGVDARDTRSGPESAVDGGGGIPMTLSGAGSTIDGFTLSGATTNNDSPGAFLTGPNESVDNTVFTNDGNGATVTGSSAGFTHDLVTNPAVQGAGAAGIFFDSGGGSSSTVKENRFTGNLDDSAVNIADPGGVTGNNIVIEGNVLEANAGANFVVAGGTRNLQILDNMVTGGVSDNDTGILLLGDDSGYTVEGNRISGITGASAVSLRGGFGYADNGAGVISENFFGANLRGVNVNSDTDTIVNIHDNIIVGNTAVGINVGDSPADADTAKADVNATDNYFGCNTGPSTPGCDSITDTGTGSFDTLPYIVLSSTVASSSLAPAGSTTFTADLNHDNDGHAISGTVLDSAETATFGFTGGGVAPTSAPIIGGTAQTTLTAGATPGAFSATATVENSTSSQPVKVVGSGKPAIRIADASTVEGNSGTHPLVFHVSLSKPAGSDGVSMQYETVQGTATAGSDYVFKRGTLTIPPGHKTGTISVLIKGDKVKEPNESFQVTLFNPVGAFIADPNASGVIRNDDK